MQLRLSAVLVFAYLACCAPSAFAGPADEPFQIEGSRRDALADLLICARKHIDERREGVRSVQDSLGWVKYARTIRQTPDVRTITEAVNRCESLRKWLAVGSATRPELLQTLDRIPTDSPEEFGARALVKDFIGARLAVDCYSVGKSAASVPGAGGRVRAGLLVCTQSDGRQYLGFSAGIAALEGVGGSSEVYYSHSTGEQRVSVKTAMVSGLFAGLGSSREILTRDLDKNIKNNIKSGFGAGIGLGLFVGVGTDLQAAFIPLGNDKFGLSRRLFEDWSAPKTAPFPDVPCEEDRRKLCPVKDFGGLSAYILNHMTHPLLPLSEGWVKPIDRGALDEHNPNLHAVPERSTAPERLPIPISNNVSQGELAHILGTEVLEARIQCEESSAGWLLSEGIGQCVLTYKPFPTQADPDPAWRNFPRPVQSRYVGVGFSVFASQQRMTAEIRKENGSFELSKVFETRLGRRDWYPFGGGQQELNSHGDIEVKERAGPEDIRGQGFEHGFLTWFNFGFK